MYYYKKKLKATLEAHNDLIFYLGTYLRLGDYFTTHIKNHIKNNLK